MSGLSNEVEIRPAVPADADGIGRVHVRAWQWAYRGQFPDTFLDTIDLERRKRWWRNALTGEPAAVVYVAATDDEVVGYCHVGPSRSEGETVGELHSIYLLEHWTGRGVGRRLMAAALDALRMEGFGEAMLWVLGSNQDTRNFYEAAGWHDDGGRHTYVMRDQVEAAAVRYRIDLGLAR